MPENVPVASTGRCVCTVVDYRVYVDVTHTTLFAFASSEDHLVDHLVDHLPARGWASSRAGQAHTSTHTVYRTRPHRSDGVCVCVSVCIGMDGIHQALKRRVGDVDTTTTTIGSTHG